MCFSHKSFIHISRAFSIYSTITGFILEVFSIEEGTVAVALARISAPLFMMDLIVVDGRPIILDITNAFSLLS